MKSKSLIYFVHIIAFIIFILPLSVWPGSYSLTQTLALRLLSLFAFSLWLAQLTFQKKPEIKVTALTFLVLLFLFLTFLSTFFALHKHTALYGLSHRGGEGFVTFLAYFALFMVTSHLNWSTKETKTLFFSLAASSFIISIWTILQSLGLLPTSFSADPFRGGASFGNPSILASYLILGLSGAVYLLTITSSKSSQQVFALLCLFVVVIAVFLTLTRGAYVGAFLFFLLTGFIFPEKKRLLLLGIIGLLVLAVILVGLLAAHKRINLSERFNLSAGGSVESRWEIYKTVVKIIKQKPWLGTGPDNLPWLFPRYETSTLARIHGSENRTDNAHNYPLQLAATLGLPAAIIFLLIFAVFFWQSFLKSNEASFKLVGAAGTAFLVANLFTVNAVGSNFILWIFFGLVASQQNARLRLSFKLPSWVAVILLATLLVVFIISTLGATRAFLARQYFLLGKNTAPKEVAVNYYFQAAKLNSQIDTYWLFLGKAYLSLSQLTGQRQLFTNAVFYLKKGLKTNPYNSDNYIALSMAYTYAGQVDNKNYFKRAEVILLQALKYAPLLPELHMRLGRVYYATGEIKKALKHLKLADKIERDSPEVNFLLKAVKK